VVTADRCCGTAAQLGQVRQATLNGTAYAWLNGRKAVNPEAYHYWHLALAVAP
jgi:hypothetical protein